MLVLERGVDGEVMLYLPDGTRVTVMVVRINGDKIRLGFKAPQNIRILRAEIIGKSFSDKVRMSPVAPAIATERELMPAGV